MTATDKASSTQGNEPATAAKAKKGVRPTVGASKSRATAARPAVVPPAAYPAVVPPPGADPVELILADESPALTGAIDAIAQSRHGDPFALLGMHHAVGGGLRVRAWLPGAVTVHVLDAVNGAEVAVLTRYHVDGFFTGAVPGRHEFFDYRLKINWGGIEVVADDPYRFGPLLGDMDVWLLSEGKHQRPYERLGAHPTTLGTTAGTCFAVWAPNAARVSVIGDFNHWDESRHPMRLRVPSGVWELFIPDVEIGACYKYAVLAGNGEVLPDHADPYARQAELRPATASRVAAPLLPASVAPIDGRSAESRNAIEAPISIYEVHVGSWRRITEDGNRWLNWDELGDQLIPYVQDMAFTHIELMPINEHPFDGSWGYQPTGLFAPTARFGSPEAFRRFVQRCHEAGIGVLLDWVPGHFPKDEHALARFDGSHLYEYADPREGLHRDWGTLIYNYGRTEVRNFLIGNARYWIEQFGIDGLRVDAVASMLYRDYSREPGQWVPNQHGGRENLEAIAFMREMNETLGSTHPFVATIAEESTAWPGVSKPTSAHGLGFHYKWNMGWMNDTLRYMSRDPAHRGFHHNELTFGLVYGFDENFVLPLSHDEVVHGKHSLIGHMPGDRWQRFANLRLYYSFMFAHPGKKLLFMGSEFAQLDEWNHDRSLDWHLLADEAHRGVSSLVRDLNRLYRDTPALHQLDASPAGFEWISYEDSVNSVLSFVRKGVDPNQVVIAVCNFTPVPRHDYRVGVPRAGRWRECLNSDSAHYGGSNLGNLGLLQSEPVPAHGRDASLSLTLPPLGALILQWID